MATTDRVVRDDRVLPFTRGLALFIVPFLVAGFVILYLFPEHTDRLWAWPMRPTMTPMVLASAYAGGVWFFVRVARERHWHAVGTGFLSVALFATLLGVATLLHWEIFTHDNPAFWIWSGLYFVAPFLVLGAWVGNRRYAAGPAVGDDDLGSATRLVIGGIGLLALVQGLAMFAFPTTFVDLWPWPLTPLSCRVMGATVSLGCAGLVAWRDPRWTTVRVMIEVEVLMLGLMLLAAVRAHEQLDGGRALAWPLLLGIGAVLVGSVVLWTRHERPRRRSDDEVRPAAA